ncbi:hypothetical protein PR202_ga19060 [Eleusine coracana subsp. coracana]|uniref:K-box domain-containing protein n=1 Tax=Eleusine coracana subsp. coracana TaxID=191504 RepID=A0AAV5CUF0_ELECO|nr:hypothetical protein PR202_ga19060 [Eleusine coracana subsp. coracana]
MDIQQKIIREMTRMKDERSRLQIIMSQCMGEDLTLLSLQDVTNLEQHLEFSLYKVRLRKQELLDQQLLEMRRRVCMRNSVFFHLLEHLISEQLGCDCVLCFKFQQEMHVSEDLCLMVRRIHFLLNSVIDSLFPVYLVLMNLLSARGATDPVS